MIKNINLNEENFIKINYYENFNKIYQMFRSIVYIFIKLVKLKEIGNNIKFIE